MSDKSSRTVWMVCGVVALVGACLCALLVIAVAAGIYFYAQRETTLPPPGNVIEQINTVAQMLDLRTWPVWERFATASASGLQSPPTFNGVSP